MRTLRTGTGFFLCSATGRIVTITVLQRRFLTNFTEKNVKTTYREYMIFYEYVRIGKEVIKVSKIYIDCEVLGVDFICDRQNGNKD